MENKKDIVRRLKMLLTATRAGSDIADLELNDQQDTVTVTFIHGGSRRVNIAGDSGLAIIRDVIKML